MPYHHIPLCGRKATARLSPSSLSQHGAVVIFPLAVVDVVCVQGRGILSSTSFEEGPTFELVPYLRKLTHRQRRSALILSGVLYVVWLRCGEVTHLCFDIKIH
jgi:hypothetical protein